MGSGEGYLAGKGFRQRNSRCRGGHVLTRSKDWKEAPEAECGRE